MKKFKAPETCQIFIPKVENPAEEQLKNPAGLFKKEGILFEQNLSF